MMDEVFVACECRVGALGRDFSCHEDQLGVVSSKKAR